MRPEAQPPVQSSAKAPRHPHPKPLHAVGIAASLSAHLDGGRLPLEGLEGVGVGVLHHHGRLVCGGKVEPAQGRVDVGGRVGRGSRQRSTRWENAASQHRIRLRSGPVSTRWCEDCRKSHTHGSCNWCRSFYIPYAGCALAARWGFVRPPAGPTPSQRRRARRRSQPAPAAYGSPWWLSLAYLLSVVVTRADVAENAEIVRGLEVHRDRAGCHDWPEHTFGMLRDPFGGSAPGNTRLLARSR